MDIKTKKDLAAALGISRETLRRIARLPGAPTDLNLKAWREHYARARVNPVAGSPGMVTIGPDGKPIDYQTARTLKTAYQAEKERMSLEETKGNLIPKAEVAELLSKLGTMIKMRLMRMPGELPPVLEGCTAVQIEKVLDNRMRAVLNAMADDTSVFGSPAAEPAQS